jgi:glycosyltransferase involved in cell wall biosynthesis
VVLAVSGGRLSPEKNFAGFIEAAKKATNINPQLYFAVFGEGRLRPDLERQIAVSGLAGRFFLPGFRSDFGDILTEADIFVLPSFTEGLPNVVLEASMRRKPVLATTVGGTPEVVKDQESGFLFAPHETEKFAEYLVMLSRNPDLRLRLGEQGYLHVHERFSFDKQTCQYRDLYLRMLGITN